MKSKKWIEIEDGIWVTPLTYKNIMKAIKNNKLGLITLGICFLYWWVLKPLVM